MKTETVAGRKTGKNYLSSSILLVCRIRDENSPMATRKEFVSQLKKELPVSLSALLESSIAPVDLSQAVLGPGMSIFSGCSKVLEADGTVMNIGKALQIISQQLGIFFNSRESEFEPETRFCLSWFEELLLQILWQ